MLIAGVCRQEKCKRREKEREKCVYECAWLVGYLCSEGVSVFGVWLASVRYVSLCIVGPSAFSGI